MTVDVVNSQNEKVGSVDLIGQIVGPNLAASILGAGLGYSKVFAMCAMAAVAGLVIYGAMYVWLRKFIPSLARAT
jgi:hypothetical protein